MWKSLKSKSEVIISSAKSAIAWIRSSYRIEQICSFLTVIYMLVVPFLASTSEGKKWAVIAGALVLLFLNLHRIRSFKVADVAVELNDKIIKAEVLKEDLEALRKEIKQELRKVPTLGQIVAMAQRD